jgi:AraC-like DNA-binding protein
MQKDMEGMRFGSQARYLTQMFFQMTGARYTDYMQRRLFPKALSSLALVESPIRGIIQHLGLKITGTEKLKF